MELEKQLLRQNTIKSRAFTQIALDDDCIVRDNKPDVIKIIHTRGSVSFEETKVTNQTVWVTGKLKFAVLYRSDSQAGKLESLESVVDFGEKLVMEDVDELDHVRLTGQLADLAVTAINSRKLAVRALVEISASAERQSEEELVSAILEEPDVQQRQEEKEMLLLAASGHDIIRTHNELTLPGANPNISRVIYQNVDIRGREAAPAKGRIQLTGEAYVTMLYGAEDGQLVWYEAMVPFSGAMECEGEEQSLCWVRTTPAEIELEAVNDYDGEMRALSLDMVFDMDIKVWNEAKVPVLTDAYALKRRLILKRQWMKACSLRMKNVAKLRLSEQMTLEGGEEKILQLSGYEGDLQVDSVEAVDNGLLVEGILLLHILYATADDSCPVGHAFSQAAFSQLIDIPGLAAGDKSITYELEPGIDQLQVNLLDNDRYEVKAAISLSALVLNEERFEKIVDVETAEEDEQQLQSQPGLTGYIARGEVTLWDIAKRYHTTEREIIETNGLKSPRLKEGDKILIVKSVG
ncbi:MAG: DUF3794 domain-containing protein [Muribaculaceae bacterium]|nr:DUF3794 domain-containing protein [Roseburia sp.]MCM1431422.1 DUF3794 domain-containing protein [Muribaculaceae bacterium]MCM1491864.1 DUF3794 domain-containing protein [Muribaculaceae bacterium]